VEKRDAWRDERVAREYDERRFHGPLARLKHRRDVRVVLALLAEAGAGRRVLDVACGTGRILPELARAGYRPVGADVALEMLRAGRVRHGRATPLLQAEAARLPFPSGAFDAVVSLRFLFHAAPAERAALLGEMRRVSGKGGVVAEVCYRWTWKHLGRYLRSRLGLAARYRPSQGRAALARELASAGLELVRLRPVSRLFSDKAIFLARARADPVSGRPGFPRARRCAQMGP
jgi:ubiquinone/menaquinone biosynthesis C-methylase UbiE